MSAKQRVATLLVVWGISGSAFAAEPTKDSLATVKQNIADQKAVLVDVREKVEWDAGHIAGAIFLPLSELSKDNAKLPSLPKDKILYTHCMVGKRSLTAAGILEKQGYQVRCLKPGYKDLLAAGFEPAKP